MERIPILKMGDFLLVTIQVDMHDRLAIALQDDLMDRIASTSARGVLIDISALEIVDSFIRRMIGNIAAMRSVSPDCTSASIQALAPVCIIRAGCIRTDFLPNFGELRKGEVQLRRIHLPRTLVNKGSWESLGVGYRTNVLERSSPL